LTAWCPWMAPHQLLRPQDCWPPSWKASLRNELWTASTCTEHQLQKSQTTQRSHQSECQKGSRW
jgi:hypothetical protein